LRAELIAGLAAHPPYAARAGRGEHALIYSVDVVIGGPNGRRAVFRSGWQVDAAGAAPRFDTGWIEGQSFEADPDD